MTKKIALTPAEGAALRRENKVLKSHVLDMTRKMQMIRRGRQLGLEETKPGIVFDFASLQEGPTEEMIESKRLRLKCEKLVKLCLEANICTQEVELDQDDEALLTSHSLQVQELQEQITELMNCQFDDCASTTSGLTMEMEDFDDRSVATSGSTSVMSILSLSNQSVKTCEYFERTKKMEMEDSILEVNFVELDREAILRSSALKLKTEKDEDNLNRKLKEREESLRAINNEIEESECKLSALKEEEKCLKVTVDEVCILKSYKDTIQEKEDLCDRINAQVTSLRAQVKSLNDEKCCLVEEVEELQNLTDLISELSAEKAAKSEAENKLESATKEIEKLTSARDALEQKMEAHKKEVTMEKENRAAAEEQATELESRVKELEEKLKEQEKEQPQQLVAKPSELPAEKTVKSILLERTIELPRPPLAKKRKTSPSESAREWSPVKRMSTDVRSVISSVSVSALLADYNPKLDDDHSSVMFGGDNNKVNHEDFNASFDNQSAISGAFSTGGDSMTSEHRAIRLHAQKLLFWADKALGKNSDAFSVSVAEKDTRGSGAFPRFQGPYKSRPGRESTIASGSIRRDHSRSSSPSPSTSQGASTVCHEKGCSCSNSIFSGNAAHTEFFLPKLGLACNCGAKKRNDDPTALKSFLRSWQESYLRSVGVYTAEQLTSRYETDGQDLARAMKHWRNSKRMKPARTKSCLIALQIWSKTAKTILKSDRKRKHSTIQRSGTPHHIMPSFLEITVDDNDDVSVMSMDDALLEGEFEI